jgi:hypothetical protein
MSSLATIFQSSLGLVAAALIAFGTTGGYAELGTPNAATEVCGAAHAAVDVFFLARGDAREESVESSPLSRAAAMSLDDRQDSAPFAALGAEASEREGEDGDDSDDEESRPDADAFTHLPAEALTIFSSADHRVGPAACRMSRRAPPGNPRGPPSH